MNIKIDVRYNTQLYQLLNNIKEEDIFYTEYNLRHPLALYNIALGNVFDHTIQAMEAIKNYDLRIRDKYELFLSSIIKFLDEMYNIIKCFYPNDKSIKAKFAKEWLKKATAGNIDKYIQAVESRTEAIQYIYNKIKHENGRLALIEAKSVYKGKCKGYFLETCINGTITPDINVHKMHNGEYTAFSFLTDMSRNLITVFFVCEKTYKFIIDEINYKVNEGEKVEEKIFKKEIEKIIIEVYKLSEFLFPDEYEKEFGCMLLDGNILNIRDISPQYFKRRFENKGVIKFILSTGGDGVTKSYQLPYIGSKSSKPKVENE